MAGDLECQQRMVEKFYPEEDQREEKSFLLKYE